MDGHVGRILVIWIHRYIGEWLAGSVDRWTSEGCWVEIKGLKALCVLNSGNYFLNCNSVSVVREVDHMSTFLMGSLSPPCLWVRTLE